MIFAVIALIAALIVSIFLHLKRKDEVNEQTRRVQESQRAAEKVKEQQLRQEVQHKQELRELHRQKDELREQSENRYKQDIRELIKKHNEDQQQAVGQYQKQMREIDQKITEERQQFQIKYKEQLDLFTEKEAELQKKFTALHTEINKLAQVQCQEWIQNQCEAFKREQSEIAKREAEAAAAQWLLENEERIRQDAIRRNHAVNLGKITEHFIPYLPGFDFNPKDARFIGTPIDFVVFDGMDEDDVREIVFVEVKTGAATLTRRQRQIRDAVNSHRCRWKLINLDEAKRQSRQLLFQAAL